MHPGVLVVCSGVDFADFNRLVSVGEPECPDAASASGLCAGPADELEAGAGACCTMFPDVPLHAVTPNAAAPIVAVNKPFLIRMVISPRWLVECPAPARRDVWSGRSMA
jgi:hypothetical protein